MQRLLEASGHHRATSVASSSAASASASTLSYARRDGRGLGAPPPRSVDLYSERSPKAFTPMSATSSSAGMWRERRDSSCHSSHLAERVAAIEEASDHVRAQFQCDMARLELQLQQLRQAAEWVAVPEAAGREADQRLPGGAEGGSNASHQLTEMCRELELLELALVKARQENGALREENESCKAAHARDVATLETMLQQALAENARLTAALDDALRGNAGNTRDHVVASTEPPKLGYSIIKASTNKVVDSLLSPTSRITVDEPEVERSSDFDAERSKLGSLGEHSNSGSSGANVA